MISRRRFLGAAVATGAAAAMPWWAGRSAVRAAEPTPALRFVHLSDIHMRPELGAAKGLARCLEAVHGLRPRPAFILTGGDHVHDARNDSFEGAKAKFDLFTDVMKDTDIPIRYCVGNHDCFGWGPKSAVPTEHMAYGKKMLRDALGVDELTHAFDAGGWRLCVVDDILPTDFGGQRGYQGGFDEAAMDFVDRTFTDAGDRPKLLCTHIPITSAVAMTYSDDTASADRQLPTSLVCRNAKAILALLRKHRVQVALTGHLHQCEQTAYQHTTHLGQGAVCGKWWVGPNAGTAEGFGVIDLHPDGTYTHAYATFGWHAVEG